MKEISEWLSEFSSHDIYDAAAIAKAFKDETGKEPCWREISANDIRAMIERRGLGGEYHGDGAGIGGYMIAEALAFKYANKYRSPAQGRGRIFFDCLEALRKTETQRT